MRVLCLGELLSSNPYFQQDSLRMFEKVHTSLRTPSQAAKLRQELTALGQGPAAGVGSSSDSTWRRLCCDMAACLGSGPAGKSHC